MSQSKTASEEPFQVLLHIDMDCFYAAIAKRDHPELRDKKVIVARARRPSVVSAADYEVRQTGVHAGMATSMALSLCPDAVRVVPDYGQEIATTPKIFEKRNNCNPNVAMSRYQTLIADLAVASVDKQAGKDVKTKAGQICKTNLVPTFCFKYPLPPRWNKKAKSAYAEFRKEYKALLAGPFVDRGAGQFTKPGDKYSN